jgi:uncharacterized protein
MPGHPLGASPLSYLAMMRFDTVTNVWGDVQGAGEMADVLVAFGAPVNGRPTESETPLITAASYGADDVAAVLIAAGADLDVVAKDNAGGVPGGSGLLHAAVFGMTGVLDLLARAGAKVRSLEEAAAAGDLSEWSIEQADEQTRIRALVMAAHHQRIDVLSQLITAGTPFDIADENFGRHPLRLAAASGRPASVRALLGFGADPLQSDRQGLKPVDHCCRGRLTTADPSAHDEVQTLLA